MPSVLHAVLGVIVAALALGVLVASVVRGCVRRYFFVNLSVAVLLLCDAMRWIALYQYGFSSKQYFSVFYLTDALLVASTYLLILSFFDVIFGRTALGSQVRMALAFFVILVAAVSYAMISRSLSPHFYSRLMLEFLQNMYFAAVLLTVLLWISFNFLRVEDRQMGLLIAGLGLGFSVLAANYAIQTLMPRDVYKDFGSLLRHVPPFATILKLGLWCYAVSFVAEPVAIEQRQAVVIRRHAEGTA